MPLAWPDDETLDVDSSSWDSEPTTSARREEDLASDRSRCAVLGWWRGSSVTRQRFIRTPDEPRRTWLSSLNPDHVPYFSWSEVTELATDRLWDALGSIKAAIGELDAAPLPPSPDLELVARSLDDLVQRLVRLERALPIAETNFYAPAEEQGVAVDWRRINREQANGLPRELCSEEGTALDRRQHIESFDVFADEDDGESILE